MQRNKLTRPFPRCHCPPWCHHMSIVPTSHSITWSHFKQRFNTTNTPYSFIKSILKWNWCSFLPTSVWQRRTQWRLVQLGAASSLTTNTFTHSLQTFRQWARGMPSRAIMRKVLTLVTSCKGLDDGQGLRGHTLRTANLNKLFPDMFLGSDN